MNDGVGAASRGPLVSLVSFVAGCLVAGGVGYAVGANRSTRAPTVTAAAAVRVAPGPSGDAATTFAVSPPEPVEPPEPIALAPRGELGRKAFFDPGLSEPPGTSCASCHDPAHGYAGTNGSTSGVAHGSRPGRFARRTTPSVLYLKFVRPFRMHWDEEADAPEPSGGFFWDGRSDSLSALAQQPLLNPNEMGNRNLGSIARYLEKSAYASDLRAEFDGVFDSPERAVEALGDCLEAFLTSGAMSPFSSRYDEYVRGRVQLTPEEARGLALFEDHAKGACSSCHKMDHRSPRPERSLFTDFGYDAVAPPRNRDAAPDAGAPSFDLGLCERKGTRWHIDDDRFCGTFRTPSLRNAALRTSFMHNGAFSSLHEVVAFYATRATDPERWYAHGHFDDLPAKYWPNVNTNPAPYHRSEGEAPVLDDRDVDALVAFLETLTDTAIPRP
jgi:cytochrome c peroxidase